MHVAGVQPTPAPSSTSTRARSATSATCWSPSSPARAPSLRKAQEIGLELSGDDERSPPCERLKEREHRGYHYEAADASFELLLATRGRRYEPLFRLESFRVITEKREDGRVETEATIKIWVDGERLVRTAEGNGPVNALDRALREAIGARTRTSPTSSWSTTRSGSSTRPTAPARSPASCSTRPTASAAGASIGVSENIIEATWEALVDSLEYGMLRGPKEEE